MPRGLLFIVVSASVACKSLGLKTDRKLPPSMGSECECVNWSDAYTKYYLQCGLAFETQNCDGNPCEEFPEEYTDVPAEKEEFNQGCYECPEVTEEEFHALKRSINKTKEHEDLCTNFFEKRHDNYCTNFGRSQPFPLTPSGQGQWCLVSADCQDLNDGGRHLGELAWKHCIQGEDKMLQDKTPEELQQMATSQHLDVELLTHMAYEVIPESSVLSKDAEAFWEDRETFLADPDMAHNGGVLSFVTAMQRPFFLNGPGGDNADRMQAVIFNGLNTTMRCKLVRTSWYWNQKWEHGHAHPEDFYQMECERRQEKSTAT